MRVKAGKVLFHSNGGSTADPEQFAQWNYVICLIYGLSVLIEITKSG